MLGAHRLLGLGQLGLDRAGAPRPRRCARGRSRPPRPSARRPRRDPVGLRLRGGPGAGGAVGGAGAGLLGLRLRVLAQLAASACAADSRCLTRSSTFSVVTVSVAARSWRRSDSTLGLRAGQLGGEVGAAGGRGVAFGRGHPQVVVQAADLAIDLFAVVAAHRGVETAAGLVERKRSVSRLAHAAHGPHLGPVRPGRPTYRLRNRLIASRCLARSCASRTPRPSSGARHSTPTLPWCRLRWTS